MLMHSQHKNLSFERLAIPEAARGKHLFFHSVLDAALLIEPIMELFVLNALWSLAFSRINVNVNTSNEERGN